MRISSWSSDVFSSVSVCCRDRQPVCENHGGRRTTRLRCREESHGAKTACHGRYRWPRPRTVDPCWRCSGSRRSHPFVAAISTPTPLCLQSVRGQCIQRRSCHQRSEEHTSELQSLMRISYAVFCLKKKTTQNIYKNTKQQQNNNTNIN